MFGLPRLETPGKEEHFGSEADAGTHKNWDPPAVVGRVLESSEGGERGGGKVRGSRRLEVSCDFQVHICTRHCEDINISTW